jgi:hypothetical protein
MQNSLPGALGVKSPYCKFFFRNLRIRPARNSLVFASFHSEASSSCPAIYLFASPPLPICGISPTEIPQVKNPNSRGSGTVPCSKTWIRLTGWSTGERWGGWGIFIIFNHFPRPAGPAHFELSTQGSLVLCPPPLPSSPLPRSLSSL